MADGARTGQEPEQDFPDDFYSGGRADSPLQHLPGRVILLLILAIGIGAIGVFTGFATVLGILATAAGDAGELDYTAAIATSVVGLSLGLGLWVGAYLLWRRRRSARVVLGLFTLALVLSTAWQMVSDALSFVTVISTVMSAAVIAFTFYLLLSPEVRAHVRGAG